MAGLLLVAAVTYRDPHRSSVPAVMPAAIAIIQPLCGAGIHFTAVEKKAGVRSEHR
jgi:hypothetical protein